MIFPGTKIKNRYRADKLLGRGGMGEVWKCFDESLDRNVVIKIVAPELAKTRPQHTSIFVDEARIGASLVGHPNVVTVFDILTESDGDEPLLAIVMEFVEGLSCARWIELAPSRVDSKTQYYISLQVAIEICKALSYAHRHSILHRDVKPLNVFISKYGITKIGDFGIARYADAVTREHTVWNFRSPAYSAPEQWQDGKPTARTDMYQLGCTLFHLFTGKLPFEAANVAALIQKHLTASPAQPRELNPLITEDISTLIVKCLGKKTHERPGLWEVVDAIAKEVQKTYEITIECDKSNLALIDQINGITEFNKDPLKEDGKFTYHYADYNEAISEAMELTMLPGVKVQLKAIGATLAA